MINTPLVGSPNNLKLKEMKNRTRELLLSALMLGGDIPDIKLSADVKRVMKDNRPNNPPRSMTDEEKAYYAKHKNFNGFKPSNL